MYSIIYTNKFKKGFKLCSKRNLDISKLREVVNTLQETGKLPSKYKPHKLQGIYSGLWECHIEPDWLLIWEQNEQQLVILLLQTGTHSDLF